VDFFPVFVTSTSPTTETKYERSTLNGVIIETTSMVSSS